MDGSTNSLSLSGEDAIEVLSNWEVENDRRLVETLTLSAYINATQCQLENMVNYESCVHLLGTNDSLCELKMKSTSPTYLLAQICIVSEARIIEIYGKHGEYLMTSRAEFLDDFEGMSVYSAVIKLPDPCIECMLKLIPMKRNEQSMWMYGMNVALEKKMPTKQIDPSVNFENVNKIIKESGHQLTEKAERCKAFLQQYSSMSVLDPNKFPSKPPDPQMLMKMLQSAYLPPGQGIGEQAKNVSKHLSDLLPEFSLSKLKFETNDAADVTRVAGSQESAPKNLDLELLKDHVDQRLASLETKLIQILDVKLKDAETRQNNNLEMILMRLDNIQKSLSLKKSNSQDLSKI